MLEGASVGGVQVWGMGGVRVWEGVSPGECKYGTMEEVQKKNKLTY